MTTRPTEKEYVNMWEQSTSPTEYEDMTNINDIFMPILFRILKTLFIVLIIIFLLFLLLNINSMIKEVLI